MIKEPLINLAPSSWRIFFAHTVPSILHIALAALGLPPQSDEKIYANLNVYFIIDSLAF